MVARTSLPTASTERRVNRSPRRILRLGAALGALLVGASAAVAADYKQAPMLDPLVADGTLPPVEERLPANPRVVEPFESIGTYGGTWRSGMVGGSDRNWLFRIGGYEPLVAWDREWSGAVIPNLAESVTPNEDSTVFTVKLRDGLKWSDGEPFTSDDLGFFVEDIAGNAELLPNGISWMMSGGELPAFEKIDDSTFTLTFKEPYGLFPQRLASGYGVQAVMMAKHYCSQFMPAYNEAGLADLQAAENVASWTELFIKKCAVDTEANERWQNPDRPVMEAWKIKDPYVSGATVVTLERNPYYFKVDPEGNQLPYIDDMRISVNADVQTLVLKVLNGEIDYQDRHINSNANRPVFADAMESADLNIVLGEAADMNTTVISLNLTHKDPVKHEIYNNKDFRIGLSHAIDRQAIIDSAFIGLGEPFQASPRREGPFFNERLAKQYTEYDVDKANEHLDKAFPDKDSSGYRLGPDGQRITINVMVMPALGDFLDSTELVVQYWQAVGIDAKMQTVDRTLFYDRKDNNEHDAAVFLGSGGMVDALFEPTFYFPFWNESLFAVPWGNWYASGGQAGEEPPAAAKKQMELYDEITRYADPEKQKELMGQLLDIAADEFYVIGVSTPGPLYSVSKKNMKNIYPRPYAWTYPTPAASNTETYYFEQ